MDQELEQVEEGIEQAEQGMVQVEQGMVQVEEGIVQVEEGIQKVERRAKNYEGAFCQDHPSCPYIYLFLDAQQNTKYQKDQTNKNQTQTASTPCKRLLCAECIYEDNKLININNCISLYKVLRSPGEMIDFIKKDDISKYLLAMKIQKLEEDIRKIREDLEQKLQEFKIIQATFKQYRSTFLKCTKFVEFETLLLDLQHQSDLICQNIKKTTKGDIDINIEIEDLVGQESFLKYQLKVDKIEKIIDEMLKDEGTLISENTSKIYYEHSSLRKDLKTPGTDVLQKEIKSQLKLYVQFLSNLYNETNSKLDFPKLEIMNEKQIIDIGCYLQSKTKKLIKQMNLIYLGSRDGLNVESFWKKVNGKKNLLMAFRSKNENQCVFGGYSPCEWKGSLHDYVQDDTETSLLFSQTHNLIFPLYSKEKQNAIYCEESSGPRFGSGCDIYITADFQKGSSNLGKSYREIGKIKAEEAQAGQKKQKEQIEQNEELKPKYNELLFGGKEPNIDECEIYELIFN